MPRKKTVYTSLLPYHVRARSNNREWFYLPMEEVWRVFICEMTRVFKKYRALPHAFILMRNHYHLLITADPEFDLGVVMQDLQKSVSLRINKLAGRTNHLFGGPYKASLIENETYYANVFRYVAQNPVRAEIVNCVEAYPFSSFSSDRVGVCTPLSGIANSVPRCSLASWLNELQDEASRKSLQAGLRKTVFKPVTARRYR